MANVCDKFRQNFRQTFIEQIVSMFGNLSEDKWFISIGKPISWLTAAGEKDSFPPASLDDNVSEIDFWRNIIAHKRITADDVSIVVPRYDWTLGTIYQPYRPDVELFNPDNPYIFYVLVDEERVYKCIDNNYGAPSVIAPTHTDSDVKKLSDGYRWKFMYSITENKRKFLLKAGLKKTGIVRPGYMPAENLESLGLDDERYLQFAVQSSAVDGEIVFIYLLPEYRDFIISDRCIFSSPENLLTESVSVGGLTASLFSTQLSPVSGYYNNMVLSIDAGQGQGQRRIIENYIPSGANTAIVTTTTPFAVELLGSNSSFSILPNIYIEGDGSAKNNTLDPQRTVANVSAKFASGTTASVRVLESFEMIDTGKDFTYGSLRVVRGLTFSSATPDSLIADFSTVATPIISPQGGHGSNPVLELGGRALMIVKKFTGNEGGKLDTQNEFRQFGIIKNPELARPYYRISTVQAGAETSFVVGATAYQTPVGEYMGGYGKIVSWHPGQTGFTGCSELVLTDVVGTFTSGVSGAKIGMTETSNALDVFDVMERKIAGSEGRDLLVLTVTPTSPSGTFSQNLNDFPKGLNAVGVGNAKENIEFTGSKGKIHKWEAQSGVNNRGRLYLEHSHGPFFVNELVGVRDRFMTLVENGGVTGIARIVEKAEVVEEIPSVYSQLSEYELDAAFGDSFADETFTKDQVVFGYTGSDINGSGIVVGWKNNGATGTLSMILTDGAIVPSNLIPYQNTENNLSNSLVSKFITRPELKYRTGQVEYIQNMRPIVRSETQEEEIKLIIEV